MGIAVLLLVAAAATGAPGPAAAAPIIAWAIAAAIAGGGALAFARRSGAGPTLPLDGAVERGQLDGNRHTLSRC